MRHVLLITALLLAGCGSFAARVLQPWVGAPESELVQKWGYPQSANDIVTINDNTKVYTYRSNNAGLLSPAAECVISFTIEAGYVSSGKYVGDNCPSFRRD